MSKLSDKTHRMQYRSPKSELYALEQQLKELKEREKYYLQLNQKTYELECNEATIARQLHQRCNEDDNLIILKAAIDETNRNIKIIDDDNRVIKNQLQQAQQQTEELERALEDLRSQNSSHRQHLQSKQTRLSMQEEQLKKILDKKQRTKRQSLLLQQQIVKLELQQQQQRQQLSQLQHRKEQQQRSREKKRKAILELKRQVQQQRNTEKECRQRINDIRETHRAINEELQNLIDFQSTLTNELTQRTDEYQKGLIALGEANSKLQQTKDQLAIASKDVDLLTNEYLAEDNLLREEQQANDTLNQQFDDLTRQAISIWDIIKEELRLQDQRTIIDTNNQGKNSPTKQMKEMRSKAYRIWQEISQLIFIPK